MTIRTGPCDPWTTAADVEADGWDVPAGVSPNTVERMVWAASDVMFQLGGRRWPGSCDRTLRPEDCSCLCNLPLPEGGVVAMRPHRTGICGGGKLLDVGVYPVTSVHAASIDGESLAGAWRIHEHRWIVRTDGGYWPCVSQEQQAAATPKIEVRVQFGEAPPELGKAAATALARELILAAGNSDSCRLDRRVRSITREGVSMDYAMPGLAESLAGGQTGIPEVDLFVHAHNPHGLRRAARFVGL